MLRNRCAAVSKGRRSAAGVWMMRLLGFGLFGVAHSALALTLGEIELRSRLHEPLEGRIPLRAVTASEWRDLRVGMASPADYRSAGVAMSPALSRLQLRLARSAAGEPYIRVLSTEAIDAPYLELLVAAQVGDDRILKAYTVLLEPPQQPASGRDVRVRRGETLWRIAERNKLTDTVTVPQMAIALQNANPTAFEGNDINRLKVGAVLRIPDLETVEALSPERAKAEFQARIAGVAAAAEPAQSVAPVAEASPGAALESPDARPDAPLSDWREDQQPAVAAQQSTVAHDGAEVGVAAAVDDSVAAVAAAPLPPVAVRDRAAPQAAPDQRAEASSAAAMSAPKGFFDDVVADVRADPVQMGLLGGGLIGLLGLLGLSKRRRRRAIEVVEPSGPMASSSDWRSSGAVFAAGGDEAVWVDGHVTSDRSADDASADLDWRRDAAVVVGAASATRLGDVDEDDLDFKFVVDDTRSAAVVPEAEQDGVLDFGDVDFSTVDTGSTRTEPAVGDLGELDAQLGADRSLGGAPGLAANGHDAPLFAAAAVDGEDAGAAAGRELETKLDLAKAYQEMGDIEGARLMLDEVLAQGDEAQREAARALMAQL